MEFMALAFLVAVVVTGLLAWAARRAEAGGRLWGLLAAAWAVGLTGNIAWGVYEVATGRRLPYVSLVDLFYLARYVLAMLAFASCLAPWTGRRWAALGGIALASAAVAGLGLVLPSPRAPGTTPAFVLSGASFPVLDGVILGLAAWSWRDSRPGRLRGALALLLVAMGAYTAANWDQYRVRVADWESGSELASGLWLVSDLLAGAAAVYWLRAKTVNAAPE